MIKIKQHKQSQPVKLIRGVLVFSVLIILVITSVFAATGHSELISGILSGGVLALINFFVIVYLVRKLLQRERSQGNYLLIFIFIGKFILLGVAIFLLIAIFQINGLGIILGLTAVFISVLIAGVMLRFNS